MTPPYPTKLYIAKSVLETPVQYSLRCTCWDKDLQWLVSRHVADLGDNPARFIHNINERSYYIAEELIDLAEAAQVKEPDTVLEDLFWPYVNAEIRRSMEWIKHRHARTVPKTVTKTEEAAIVKEIHPFDYRRLHYMFYGTISLNF